VLDTTSLADDFRTYELGMRSFTGSATLLFYANDSGRNDAETLLKAAKAGTKTSLILRLGATGTPTLKDTSYYMHYYQLFVRRISRRAGASIHQLYRKR
jgi:cell division inhibitor SulA